MLTDSNRRRNQQFFVGVRDNSGYTERAGQDSSSDEFRLDPFPQSGDAARTVVEQHGGTRRRHRLRHPDRPARRRRSTATRRTAWLVDGDVVGQHLTITADHPQTIDHITLTQRPTGPIDRSIAQVKLTFDQRRPGHRRARPVVASPRRARRSRSRRGRPAGSTSRSRASTCRCPTSLNGVGFTEIGFGDTRDHRDRAPPGGPRPRVGRRRRRPPARRRAVPAALRAVAPPRRGADPRPPLRAPRRAVVSCCRAPRASSRTRPTR